MSRLQLISIASAALLYYGSFHLNMMLFDALEQHSGANWIFLPAGLRLLCTLILAGEGAIGLLIASMIICFQTYSEMGVLTNLGASLISAGAPYLAYRIALFNGVSATLEKLSAVKLSMLSLVYALISSLLHSLWYTLRSVHTDFLSSFVVMFTGDLVGTLLVLYSVKMVFATVRRARGQT